MTTDTRQIEIENAYQMPKPRIMQLVSFYENADPNGIPHLGFVQEVYHRTIRITVPTLRQWFPDCRHMDDPKNLRGGDMVDGGGWKFREDDTILAKGLQELERTQDYLEVLVTRMFEALEKAGTKDTYENSTTSDWRNRATVCKMDLKPYRDAPLKELAEAVKAKESAIKAAAEKAKAEAAQKAAPNGKKS